MSGSGGGYYKYRCKYFLSHDCPYWVWVNHAPCPHCLAEGRDSEDAVVLGTFRLSREVYVPRFENGSLHYIIMEIVANSDADTGWTVKSLPAQAFPTVTVPSAVSYKATSGPDNPGSGKFGIEQSGGQAWK